MARLFFFLLFAAAIYLLLRKPWRGRIETRLEEPPTEHAMKCCARCGVHFPASEAVIVDGVDYCSADHANRRNGT